MITTEIEAERYTVHVVQMCFCIINNNIHYLINYTTVLGPSQTTNRNKQVTTNKYRRNCANNLDQPKGKNNSYKLQSRL